MRSKLVRTCLVASAGGAVVILAVILFASHQLSLLSGEPAFESPAVGMIERYGGESQVEITGQGTELFPSLQYVGAVVESDHCRNQERCPVGGLFLEVDDGWVFFPEGRHPLLIAAGKQLLDLAGSS